MTDTEPPAYPGDLVDYTIKTPREDRVARGTFVRAALGLWEVRRWTDGALVVLIPEKGDSMRPVA